MNLFKTIFKSQKTFIIAEAGVNHNGQIHMALQLIDAAKKAGADAVKFQTFKTEELVTAKAKMASYQKKNTQKNESQFAMIKRLEFTDKDFQKIAHHCRRKKIMFLSTPCDQLSVALLLKLKVPLIKISSAEVTNLPFLEHIAATKKPLILSTGMADLDEVSDAVQTIFKTGNKELILLHCVTEYPAPFESVNLRAIATLQKTFQLPIGLSDHTPGWEVALAAVGLGAKVIEKHLTLDQDLPGPDHKASMTPADFDAMVKAIRHVEAALGNGIKIPTANEINIRHHVRRSIVASRDLQKGEILIAKDLVFKRPAGGFSPAELHLLVGKKVRKMIKADEMISWRNIQR